MIFKYLQMIGSALIVAAGWIVINFIKKSQKNEIQNEQMEKSLDDIGEYKKTSNYLRNLSVVERIGKLQAFREAERKNHK